MKFDLPSDAQVAAKVVEAEAQESSRKLERGVMGWFFGLSAEKPGNIAGFVLVLSFALLATILVWGADADGFSKKDQVILIAGFITTTLGFIFGRSTS